MTKYIWACLMILAILMMAGCSLYKEEIRPEETLEALINSELIYEEGLAAFPYALLTEYGRTAVLLSHSNIADKKKRRE